MTHFQYLNSDDGLIESTLAKFSATPNPPEWELLPLSWPPMAPGTRYPPAEAERSLMPWAEGWEFLRVPAHQEHPGRAWSIAAATQNDSQMKSETGDMHEMDDDTIVPDDFRRPDSRHPEMPTAEQVDEDESDTETLCEEAPQRVDEVQPVYYHRWENREVLDPRTAEVQRAIKAQKARISGVLTRFRKLQKLMNRDHSPDTRVVYL